jgi:hypothetical protein
MNGMLQTIAGYGLPAPCVASELCPVCSSEMEPKELSGFRTWTCPQEHFQRQEHFNDLEPVVDWFHNKERRQR